MQSNEELRLEMFRLIEAWKQSGLTQHTWCKQNNITYHRFHYWYKQYRDEQSPSDRSSFVKLDASPVQQTMTAELLLHGSHSIIFHQPLTAGFIRELMGL